MTSAKIVAPPAPGGGAVLQYNTDAYGGGSRNAWSVCHTGERVFGSYVSEVFPQVGSTGSGGARANMARGSPVIASTTFPMRCTSRASASRNLASTPGFVSTSPRPIAREMSTSSRGVMRSNPPRRSTRPCDDVSASFSVARRASGDALKGRSIQKYFTGQLKGGAIKC